MNQEKSRTNSPKRIEVTTLGGGCFWCTEAVFSQLKGVEEIELGYSGGNVENPSYEEISTGKTGHAEVAQISFDPAVISFKEILQIFFSTHDPTSLNRQGADIGTQYRSVVFCHDDEQKAIAEQVIKEFSDERAFDAPIVTQVEPLKTFYKAEDYHREYYKRHPEQPYCRVVIAPKIAKFRQLYLDKLKLQI